MVPPDATTEVLYAVPAVAPGSEAVEMLKGLVEAAETTRLMDFVAVFAVGVVESFTVMETEAVPLAVGVPEMAPVEVFIESPPGKPETEYTYGLVPPDAATVVLYAVPAVAPGNEAVEMDNELVVVPERNRLKVAFAVCMVEEESVTVKPIEYVPPVAGKPMIASHLLVMLRPLGRPVAVRV